MTRKVTFLKKHIFKLGCLH